MYIEQLIQKLFLRTWLILKPYFFTAYLFFSKNKQKNLSGGGGGAGAGGGGGGGGVSRLYIQSILFRIK